VPPPDSDRRFRPQQILEILTLRGVDFVLVGGLAGSARGSGLVTFDVDIAYARDSENLERLAKVLQELKATLRGTPKDVPFLLEAQTLKAGGHFTFDTKYGALDILDRPAGSPRYDELKRAAGEPLEVHGARIRVASLDHLISMKEATGRPRDRYAAMEYRVLSDEIRKRDALS
jgi:hypothetical protein